MMLGIKVQKISWILSTLIYSFFSSIGIYTWPSGWNKKKYLFNTTQMDQHYGSQRKFQSLKITIFHPYVPYLSRDDVHRFSIVMLGTQSETRKGWKPFRIAQKQFSLNIRIEVLSLSGFYCFRLDITINVVIEIWMWFLFSCAVM